jgi:hypothetical protein
MSIRTYSACIKPVVDTVVPHRFPSHGAPPVDFLDVIVDSIKALPDNVITPNPHTNIFDLLKPKLGPAAGIPWTDILSRKAAMCEALRVAAAFESDYNWNEGADSTAGQETPAQTETGAWQVSADSMGLDPSLRAFIIGNLGSDHPSVFISAMKENHSLAASYAARLFTINTRWSGPCNVGWVLEAAQPSAMTEFQALLSS